MTHSFDNDLFLRLQGGLRTPLTRPMEAVVIKTTPNSQMTHSSQPSSPVPFPQLGGNVSLLRVCGFRRQDKGEADQSNSLGPLSPVLDPICGGLRNWELWLLDGWAQQ